jgi:hypothetical protein
MSSPSNLDKWRFSTYTGLIYLFTLYLLTLMPVKSIQVMVQPYLGKYHQQLFTAIIIILLSRLIMEIRI